MDYQSLAITHEASSGDRDKLVRSAFVPSWLSDYEAQTPWETEILEIELNKLTYLFDAAPTISGSTPDGTDRLVAVWGQSAPPPEARDRQRLQRFLPDRNHWSEARLDRGHFVAHSAGGPLDLNLFPQSTALNRGHSSEGRLWRRMERYAASHGDTPLFVRPLYADRDWRPVALDFGLLIEGELLWHRFGNFPDDSST